MIEQEICSQCEKVAMQYDKENDVAYCGLHFEIAQDRADAAYEAQKEDL